MRGAALGKVTCSVDEPIFDHSAIGPGDSGEHVERMQHYLRQWGLYAGPLTGRYDAATRAAVQAFQRLRAIDDEQNGIAGEDTIRQFCVPIRDRGDDDCPHEPGNTSGWPDDFFCDHAPARCENGVPLTDQCIPDELKPAATGAVNPGKGGGNGGSGGNGGNGGYRRSAGYSTGQWTPYLIGAAGVGAFYVYMNR